MPEPLLRRLFDAFRLEIRYDREPGLATAQVTVTPENTPGQRRTAETVLTDQRPPTVTDHAWICVVPQRDPHQMAAASPTAATRRELMITMRFNVHMSS